MLIVLIQNFDMSTFLRSFVFTYLFEIKHIDLLIFLNSSERNGISLTDNS